MYRYRPLVAVIGLIFLVGCAAKPVTAPRAVVPATVSSEVRVAAEQAETFGDMAPIAVGASNGSATIYDLSATRVFAVDDRGLRIAPLSLSESARQAGGTTELVAGLKGAGGGALLAGVLGAATGAIIGAATGGTGQGAAVGAGIGVAAGAIGGFYESATKTDQEIHDQLGGLYFGEQELKPGLPASGFVFFPKGRYLGVYVVAVRAGDGVVEEFWGPMVPERG